MCPFAQTRCAHTHVRACTQKKSRCIMAQIFPRNKENQHLSELSKNLELHGAVPRNGFACWGRTGDRERYYMIAMMRRIFLGSILEDLWCRKRPSGTSSAVTPSLRGGAVTGRVGSALDQKGNRNLRNLWRRGPAIRHLISSHSNWPAYFIFYSFILEYLRGFKCSNTKHAISKGV